MRLHRQHGPGASDTFGALRLPKCLHGITTQKSYQEGESPNSQRFHKKVSFLHTQYWVIHTEGEFVKRKIAGVIAATVFFVAASVHVHVPAAAQTIFSGLAIDGISCDTMEGAVEHIHAHLQIFNRGKAVPVPAQIGIVGNGGCLYWLHTHTADGIIHIEAPVKRTFTVGQFFDIWGRPIPRGKSLRVTVNGKRWSGNPENIPLRDHEEIVMQSGPPWGRAHSADWSNL